MILFMISIAGLTLFMSMLLVFCGIFVALMISITARFWENRIQPWLDKHFGESD